MQPSVNPIYQFYEFDWLKYNYLLKARPHATVCRLRCISELLAIAQQTIIGTVLCMYRVPTVVIYLLQLTVKFVL